MKASKFFWIVLSILACGTWTVEAQDRIPLQAYAAADPFVGTAGGGSTFPGATLPFGMMQWSPDTTADGWYHYEDKTIRGFSLTHISGAGCSIFADVPILPLNGDMPVSSGAGSPNDLSASFSHTNEHAHPGTYSVTLDSGIVVDLAVALRAGMGKFTFPGRGPATLVFKAGSSATAGDAARKSDASSVEVQVNDTLVGTVHSGVFCTSKTNYVLYFVAKFDRPFSRQGVWENTVTPGGKAANGHGAGAYVTFDRLSSPLKMKIGISFVSIDGAAKNLSAEISTWDFDAVHAAAEKKWHDVFDRVRVTGGTQEQFALFYTALYHMLLSPNLFSDEDGSYTGFDWKVRKLPSGQAQFANFSDWDIYRSVIQFHALLFPDQASQEAQSLVRAAEQSGWMPRWPVANDISYTMGGDSSALVISSAYAFGAHSFDARTALRYMLKSATTRGVGKAEVPGRPGLMEYLKTGYVPLIDGSVSDGRDDNALHQSSASVTLEYAGADFAISRLAAALGDEIDAKRMLQQSGNWRTLYDQETNFIRPRTSDGSFQTGFDPDHLMPHHTNWDNQDQLGFEEGSTWQYTWMIPQDYAGLFQLMGGAPAALPRLDKFFRTVLGWGLPTFTVVNEPDFCAPYAYLWLGRPWQTQEVVDRIRREAFFLKPDGLPGNDDLGATSGVYVWSALGLYPEIPGVGGFTLGTPLFPSVTLREQDGQTIQINSQGSGIYVHGVRVNGVAMEKTWLPLAALNSSSNQIDFDLGREPDRAWSTKPTSFPPSFTPEP